MTSKKIRQAFQAVLDMEPVMGAAMGNKDFYRLDGALFNPEQSAFSSTAGLAGYNQRDKDKARRLLKEAGYTGQPVRWITTREYEWMYKSALVSKQQMEEVGFKVVPAEREELAAPKARVASVSLLRSGTNRDQLIAFRLESTGTPLSLRLWPCPPLTSQLSTDRLFIEKVCDLVGPKQYCSCGLLPYVLRVRAGCAI